jgi:transcriptional regulator with XRE-family HTH domain
MGDSESFVENRQFGRYLRRVREERKLSLDTVEELSADFPDRVTKSHLSRIENGSAVPSFSKMFALSQIYGIPIAALAERFELDLRRETERTPVDASSAAELLERLDRLESAGAYGEEIAIASAALEFIDADGFQATAEQTCAIRIYLIDALAHLERYELAKVYCEELLSRKIPTKRQQLQTMLCFVICCYRLKRYTIAEMALARVENEPEVDGLPVAFRATVRSTRAVVETALGRLDRAIASYKEAISLYLKAPQPFETCRAQINLGQALVMNDEPDKALPYLRGALQTAERSGYDRLRALASSHLAVVQYRRGDMKGAESYALRSNAIARTREFVSLMFRNCFYLRAIALERGDERAAAANERTLRAYLNRVDPDLPETIEYRAELEGGSR